MTGLLNMKHLTLAAVISSVAIQSQAQIFTNDKEFIIEVAGAVTAQIISDTPANSKLSLDLADAHFNFTPKYTLENSVIAYSDLKVESANGTSGLSEGYVGLEYKGFNFSAGKQGLASNQFGISRSKELGPDSSLGQTSGEQVVKLSYTRDRLEIAMSYEFEDYDGDSSSFDVYVSGMVGDFDADATIQLQKAQASATNLTPENIFYFGYSAYYTLENFFIGGSFSMDTTKDANIASIELSSAYSLSKRITIGGGFGQELRELGTTSSIFYTNAEYLFHKEVAAFTEVGINTAAGSQLGLVAGLTVKF